MTISTDLIQANEALMTAIIHNADEDLTCWGPNTLLAALIRVRAIGIMAGGIRQRVIQEIESQFEEWPLEKKLEYQKIQGKEVLK